MAFINCSCPHCSTAYRIDEVHRGKKARCKKCSTAFVIATAPGDQTAGSPATPRPLAPENSLPGAVPDRLRGADGIPLVWEPGDVILDQYEVRKFSDTRPFIEGGMGRVNRVWNRGWQRDLVVKNIKPPRPPAVLPPAAVENFLREAEVWVDRLGLHPNIVTCHYVRVLGGLPRVFVEFVDGGDLVVWIESGQLYEGGPQRALERILDIAIQFAWGLHYTHEQGLVHQDVKPRNVMMTKDGVAKLTDFGLARARAVTEVGEAGAQLRADVTGRAGTQSYQSREQAARGRLTPATDIWSWGVSVLDMFLGEVERGAGPAALLALKQYGAAPERAAHLPQMPAALLELLRSCFQPRPEDRPKSMLEVASTLCNIYQAATGQPFPREQPNPAEALADSFNNRAVSLFDLGKKEVAEQKWQEALRVDPVHPEATYNQGLVQWRSGQLTDLKLLQKLGEVRTSSTSTARVDYLLGLVHLEQTDVQAAVQVLRKAAEAGTGPADILPTLALAQSLCVPTRQLPATWAGHTGSVNSVAWSPDGRWALSGSGDGTLRSWDTTSGQCLRSFAGHGSGVTSVAWSPNGRYALSGSNDCTVRLWEVASGKCLRTLEGHSKSVSSVSWHPEGRHVLSGSSDSTLRLWEISSGKCVHIFEGHLEYVTTVSWHPEGRLALSGSGDNTLRLWDVFRGQSLRTFAGHTGHVASVAWSPDGRRALSGSWDETLRLWDVSTGQCLRIFRGHTYGVKSVAWSPDGRHALSGSGQGLMETEETLRLWQVSSGQCLRSFQWHKEPVNSVAWSPDGRCALSASADNRLHAWQIVLPRQPVPLVTGLARAADSGRYRQLIQQARAALTSAPLVAAGCLHQAREQPGCSRREDSLELARRLSRSLAHRSLAGGWEKRTFQGHTEPVCAVAWSPDGHQALSGSADQTVRLWDISSGKCLQIFSAHKSKVTAVAWSPDGRHAISGSHDETVRLWEVSSGRCLRTLEGHSDRVHSVAWSPDGRHVLSGGREGSVMLWEVSSGKCRQTFSHPNREPEVTVVVWSPDGRFVLSGESGETRWSGSAQLWEVSSGTQVRELEGLASNVNALAWSPNGRHAFSGDLDGMATLWEVATGRSLRTFSEHTAAVKAVAWSPDGRFVLSGSADRTVRLWEVASGQCLRTFAGHGDSVTTVAWSPNGHFVLSGSADRTLRLWELDWEFELQQPADWDEGARHFLTTFLTLQTPYAAGLTRQGKPTWTEDDFRCLLDRLGCAGYGWLRPEGVRRELEKMTAAWAGPPPLGA